MLWAFQCFITNTRSQIFTLKSFRKSYLVRWRCDWKKEKIIHFSLFQIIALFGCLKGDFVSESAESLLNKLKLRIHFSANKKRETEGNNKRTLIREIEWIKRRQFFQWKLFSQRESQKGQRIKRKLQRNANWHFNSRDSVREVVKKLGRIRLSGYLSLALRDFYAIFVSSVNKMMRTSLFCCLGIVLLTLAAVDAAIPQQNLERKNNKGTRTINSQTSVKVARGNIVETIIPCPPSWRFTSLYRPHFKSRLHNDFFISIDRNKSIWGMKFLDQFEMPEAFHVCELKSTLRIELPNFANGF